MRWDVATPYRLIMTIPAVGYRGLLPVRQLSDPVPELDEVRRIRRSPRDWLVDALCFLLAIGFTVLTLVDSIDEHLAPVPLAVDVALGGLSCLALWLRRRWPVGVAVIVGLFSIYAVSASGRARLLDSAGSARVRGLLAKKYGILGKLTMLGSKIRRGADGTVGVRVTAD